MNLKPIQTEEEYEAALAVIDDLLKIGEDDLTEEQLAELVRVSEAVEKYESIHYPFPAPDPQEP